VWAGLYGSPRPAEAARVLPDLSVFWVIGLILSLAVILDRLVFRPVLRVVAQREQAVSSAQVLAERAAEEARRAGAEFERKTQDARANLHRQMEELRRTALEERTALMGATRREADQALAEARASLADDVERARSRLEADADSLAAEATHRILGRRPS
jgi:F-type H+-transporting ATPase subunit b